LLAVEKQTGKTPEILLNKPVLHERLVWVYEAFWLIDASRPIYQGSVGRILLSEMAAYMELFTVRETEAKHTFIRMMRAHDSVYVRVVNEELTRKLAADRKADEERAARGR